MIMDCRWPKCEIVGKNTVKIKRTYATENEIHLLPIDVLSNDGFDGIEVDGKKKLVFLVRGFFFNTSNFSLSQSVCVRMRAIVK